MRDGSAFPRNLVPEPGDNRSCRAPGRKAKRRHDGGRARSKELKAVTRSREKVMEAKHREAFFKVADDLQCWVGVREPNLFAGRWIGKPRCGPKPKSCEAKTADNRAHPFAGLVVNPVNCPQAFQADSAATNSVSFSSHQRLSSANLM